MRFAIRVLVVFALGGALASPGVASVIIEYTGASTNAAGISTTWTHAQGFFISGTPTVTEVQVKLQRIKGTSGNIFLEIRGTTQDYPAAGYYRRVLKPVTDIPTDAPAWVSFAMSPGTQLPGGTFWIVLMVSSGSDADINWQNTAGNPFGNGNDFMTSFDGGSTWPTLSNVDANFKLIGSRTSKNTNTVVTATPSALTAGGASTIEVTVRDTASNLVQGPGSVNMTAPQGSFDKNPITLDGGKASCIWTAPMAAGNVTVTANYQGHGYDGVDYGASSGNRLISVSNQNRPTTTAQTLNPNVTLTRTQINISVQVKDNLNQPVTRGTVSFSCSAGTFGSNAVAIGGGGGGIANNTWSIGNTAGVFPIKASYVDNSPGTGGIFYGPSSDTDNVTVNLTPVPTTTTVRISPDYPYISRRSYITAEVRDNLNKLVPGGTVQFSAPSGSFVSNPIALKGGIGIAKWNAPASAGNVTITATYQQTDLAGNRYLTSNSNGVAHVTQDNDATGTDLSLMTEWNTAYSSAPLTGTQADAEGFMLALAWHGYSGVANFNDGSWEDDMKRSADGGQENDYMDTHDWTYYSGHGAPDFITFITNHDDTELHHGEAKDAWGTKDAEWVAFSACKVMAHDSDWKKTMEGLHMMCGFTVNEPDTTTLGKNFANLMVKSHEYDEPHGIAQSWFLAGAMSRLFINQRVISEDANTWNDYTWGQGAVAADPVSDANYLSMDDNMAAPGLPVCDARGPYNATAGQPVQFTATGSNPQLGSTLFFIWDVRTGLNTDAGDWDMDTVDTDHDDADLWGKSPSYVFDTPGVYNIQLMVVDDDWVGTSSDVATVNVAAAKGAAKSPPVVGDGGGGGGRDPIEIVDNYPSLPPEVAMPTFKMIGTTIGYNEMMNIAGYFNMQGGDAGMNDDLGNWEMAKGTNDLMVNSHSAAVMYVDRSRAFQFTAPVPPPPSDTEAISIANAFLTANVIQHTGSMIAGVEGIRWNAGLEESRSYVSSFTFQKYVAYQRFLPVGPQQYPVVGPGGHIGVLVDQLGDAVMFVKVWRNLYQYTELPLTPAPIAIAKLHEIGIGALIQNPGIQDACTRLTIDNVSVGYYEDDFTVAQDTVYPVYILDMTVEDPVSIHTVQGYMWAHAPLVEATITLPDGDAEVQYGESVRLTGEADYGTPPYTYVWSSDGAGELGTGSDITVDLPGSQKTGEATQHTIVLTVTDVNGMVGRDTVSVKVLPTNMEEARNLEDDDPVWLLGQVTTAVFPGLEAFYVEKPDRSAGIAVGIWPYPEVGDMMSITGTMDTFGAERIVINGEAEVASKDNDLPPVFMLSREMGGESPGANCPGITDAYGLFNVGMLVTICGKVTYSDSTCFWVDDGVALDDGSGHLGVKVNSGGLGEPDENDYAFVTGISGAEISGEKVVRVLRPRTQDDIVPYEP